MRLAVGMALTVTWISSAQDVSSPRAIVSPGARAVSSEPAGKNTDFRIRDLERGLSEAPGDLKLQTALAAAYLQKLRETADGTYLERTSKLVEHMLEHDGGNFSALRLQNEIDLQRHDFRAVADRARDMAKYAPSDSGNWGNLGDALMELGEYEAAGAAYTRMFAIRPNLASYNRLGYFRFVTGDASGAIALMRQAVDAAGAVPENTAWCWAELGDMYFKTAQLAEAESAYRSALALFPGLHRAWAGLARVNASQGHIEAAIRNYEHAQSIVPMVEYAGSLEDLYRKLGRAAKAEEQARLVDVIDTLGRAAREQTNRALAIVLADHNRRLDRALELVKAEIPVRGDVYTWDALSWVLFKLGRFPEARDASVKAVRLSTPEPTFYLHAAQIAEAVGDTETAAGYRQRLKTKVP
jgi:tetratricopeptide (TPR) repeat protein